MGTRVPQGLLLLLFLPMLPPRGASAGSLHNPGEFCSGNWALATTHSSASTSRTLSLEREQSRWRQRLNSLRAPPVPEALAGEPGGNLSQGVRMSGEAPDLPRPRRRCAGLSECFQVNGADYRGHQNRTGPRGAGRPCLFWDQTQQHSYSSASDPQGRWGLGAHNFCR